MDFQKPIKLVPNPRTSANPISRLLFLWIIPFLRKAYGRDLTSDDLFQSLDHDSSKRLGDALDKAWRKQIERAKSKGTKPRLHNALLDVFGVKIFFGILLVGLSECIFRVAQSLCLKYLVDAFSSSSLGQSDRKLRQYLFGAGLCLSTLLWTLITHPGMFALQHIGMKCRIALSSLVYRKSLKIGKSGDVDGGGGKGSSSGGATIGRLVNLLSNDVNRFDVTPLFIAFLFAGPIQMVILTYLVYQEIGYSCFGGIGFILFLMPIQLNFGKLFAKYRMEISKRTDERGRLMAEIIVAMRVIKMYAWEKPFASLVEGVRRDEVKVLRKTAFVRALYMSLNTSSASIIAFLTFLVYVLTDNTLTASKVFFTTAAFGTIRQMMVNIFPMGMAGLGDLWVALTRLEDLLLSDEMSVSPRMKVVPLFKGGEGQMVGNGPSSSPALVMDDVGASWVSGKPTLDHVSVNLRGDSLVMVVGSVGSGKTSFLHAIISELPISSGSCTVVGSTSFATQEPWIFGGTLRQNILFGLDYNARRYEEVIEAAALKEDLKQLPFGENTIVGERGVALSGGQKARVNLARALYRQADIYLLDDPLSAVDPKVSRHLFEKCARRHLQGKLRILVTHQLQYLPQADHVIVFHEGRIVAQGNYEDLIEQGTDFVHLMSELDDEHRKSSAISASVGKLERQTSVMSVRSVHSGATDLDEGGDGDRDAPTPQAEAMSTGSINVKLYWQYFKSGDSTLTMLTILIGFLLSQLLVNFTEIWLSRWTNEEERRDADNGTSSDNSSNGDLGQNTYIYVYSGATVALFLVSNVRGHLFFSYCMKISIKVHNRMFRSLIRAPTSFFDSNPSGRVMNRFTKDLGSMDDFLPPAFFDTVTIFLSMFGIIVVVCVSNYLLIAPSVILIVVLVFLRKFYIATARSVKRIESVSRSPLFTHLTASVQGLTTIRASQAQPVLTDQFDGYQDIHSSAWYIFIASNRWLAIWLELFCFLFLVVVTLIFILVSDNALVGNVGLAISSLLAVTGNFQWGVRQSAEMENNMTSVERALEYASLKPEAPLESSSDKKPPPNWPSAGACAFNHVYLAYEQKDVLQNLSFEIRPKEKIGIVGRTGAGKSSIISALFRMTEPREGQIYIDGVCINEIGLHDLRSNISIIPQDPVLFSGSVRYNLDPFNQFEDNDLWRVLQDVDLKDAVQSLDFKVSDGGANFSVGQRQLVCLARAILRQNRIIVMDEATANVDLQTDNFIQRTIREKFADCTIITIAHRLQSVMDCDRILVLDAGSLKEYDHPHLLLDDPSGYLTMMVKQTGKSSEAVLRQIAAETFNGKTASFRADNLDSLSLVEEIQEDKTAIDSADESTGNL